jgi:hypothetical protein
LTSRPIHHDKIEDAIDWPFFTSADAKYRALVAVSQKCAAADSPNITGYPSALKLSEVESAIFGVEAADAPALHWAYERYENLIGRRDSYFGEFRYQERIDHEEFYRGEGRWSFNLAVGFMVAVCGLSPPKCVGWVARIVSANVRGPLYH